MPSDDFRFCIACHFHISGGGAIPTRNVSLTAELDSYVKHKVQSGHYENASEVIRAAIRELKQSEEEDQAIVEALGMAITERFQGPFVGGPTVMAECESVSV